MAQRTWQTIKVRYCHHVNADVSLEADMVYPAVWLPESAPRIIAHRCSRALACNLEDKASCVWAGTNPAFDPFLETE